VLCFAGRVGAYLFRHVHVAAGFEPLTLGYYLIVVPTVAPSLAKAGAFFGRVAPTSIGESETPFSTQLL